MKFLKYVILTLSLITIYSCEDKFIDDLFEAPVAKFDLKESITAGQYEVYESVVFQNTGKGQSFVVFTGDKGHVYGKAGDVGASTAANGSYSYSYNEVGEYTAVWIASSIKGDGQVVESIDSVKIKVISTNGGLELFSIPNIIPMTNYPGSPFYVSDGVFVSDSEIVCPIIYSAWRNTTFNTFKQALAPTFTLSSSNAKMYWVNSIKGEDVEFTSGMSKKVIWFTDDQKTGAAASNSKLAVQEFKVKTTSGISTSYFVAPIMIPQFTEFKVNVDGTDYIGVIKQDLLSYTKYNVELSLPNGVDLTSLVPSFKVLNDDVNLIDDTNISVKVNGQTQQSSATSVDFSSKNVIYDLDLGILGNTNPKLRIQSQMIVTIK